jgi:phosphoglycerol transferase MdoB-like AlkP superfamily enzyme
MLHYFWQRVKPFVLFFLVVHTLVRLAFLYKVGAQFGVSVSQTLAVLGIGLVTDIAVLAVFLSFWALYLTILPQRFHASRLARIANYAGFALFTGIMLFGAVSEWLFWDEFYVRFNFIAVDYLIYTQEVIGNIEESYPLALIFSVMGAAIAFIVWAFRRLLMAAQFPAPSFSSRIGIFTIVSLFAASASYGTINLYQLVPDENLQEVAKNGGMSFAEAFINNELDYHKFYATETDANVARTVRGLLKEDNSDFVSADENDLTRKITRIGAEKHKNVIIVGMESLSGNYMKAFGSKDNITPNLNELSKEGLFFTNLYATGTRTVRGLEAITLSIPPTPGQSIVRRPGNENLFSLGFVFKDRGYDTKFIYGGYGYFDNMNAFFSGNGFDIVDRASFAPKEIQFANIWGICDEDVFNRLIREGSKSYASGKPFFHIMMTTSNHRPYTYPEGRIDIAPKTNRHGGVKYADYAVGDFIKKAKLQPWFKDTVFVFVADHTAGSSGKIELDPKKYHIPMIFYSPGFIAPKRYEAIASQIDLAPTLLGLLNFSYYTKFYGEDVLNNAHVAPRAFISNYQKVALMDGKAMTILEPKRDVDEYLVSVDSTEQSETIMGAAIKGDNIDPLQRMYAVSLIQSAAGWKTHFQKIDSVVK